MFVDGGLWVALVRYMPNQNDMVSVFHALGDKTRMGIVAALASGPQSVSALSRDVPMAMPSFLQHLKLLEACGLVQSKKEGRVRVCTLVPGRLSAAQSWIETQRRLWADRLDNLDEYLTGKDEPPGRR